MDWQTDGGREGRMNRKPRLNRLCDTKWCVVMIWNQNFLWGYKMLCDFRFHWNEELYPSHGMYWCMSVCLSVCVCMANFLLYWKLSVLFSFFPTISCCCCCLTFLPCAISLYAFCNFLWKPQGIMTSYHQNLHRAVVMQAIGFPFIDSSFRILFFGLIEINRKILKTKININKTLNGWTGKVSGNKQYNNTLQINSVAVFGISR